MTDATSHSDTAAATEVDGGLQVSVAVFEMELLGCTPRGADHVAAEAFLHERLFLPNVPREYSAVGTR